MLLTACLLAGVIALAWANGANDTGKPVATLVASGAWRPRPALLAAAGAGLLGSVAAIWWAADLSALFAGRGLVDERTRSLAAFAPSLTIGAAGAVLAAGLLGLPVSTTHALIGAMIGSALAGGGQIAWSAIASKVAGPLLLAPLLAVAVGGVLVMAMRRWGGRGRFSQALHRLCALAIAAARGLQDAPKIAALLVPALAVPAAGSGWLMVMVGVAIAGGGVLAGSRVLGVMSTRLVQIDGRDAEAAGASLGAAALLFTATPLALPVSTTHVTTSALVSAGLGGGLSWRWLGGILLAWVTTLPAASLAGAGAMLALGRFGG